MKTFAGVYVPLFTGCGPFDRYAPVYRCMTTLIWR
jgi:hypothetical protein